MAAFVTLGSRTVAEESFLRLDRAVVAAPDGSVMERLVVAHPGAVATVPLLGTDVLLIEQHRVAIGGPLLEIPAGKLDVPGEDPAQAAIRELEEEVGYTPEKLERMTDLLTTPGFSDERIIVYLASGLRRVPARPAGVEEQHAQVIRMPLEEAVERVRAGVICDAKSVAGLLLAAGR